MGDGGVDAERGAGATGQADAWFLRSFDRVWRDLNEALVVAQMRGYAGRGGVYAEAAEALRVSNLLLGNIVRSQRFVEARSEAGWRSLAEQVLDQGESPP